MLQRIEAQAPRARESELLAAALPPIFVLILDSHNQIHNERAQQRAADKVDLGNIVMALDEHSHGARMPETFDWGQHDLDTQKQPGHTISDDKEDLMRMKQCDVATTCRVIRSCT